jgi:large subunit ribosomal protein L21
VGTVTREGRGKKIIVFRYKSKKRYRRKTGHRQDYTYLTITDIQAEGKSLVADAERQQYEEQANRSAMSYLARLGLTESEPAEAEEEVGATATAGKAPAAPPAATLERKRAKAAPPAEASAEPPTTADDDTEKRRSRTRAKPEQDR